MVALVENPLRYTAEARLLRQAMEGDCEAANRVLLYLSSDNPNLRQMMQATFHDLSASRLWADLLCCLAYHQWGMARRDEPGLDCERRLDAIASARIDRTIIEMFLQDESPWEAQSKEAVLRTYLQGDVFVLRSYAAYLLGLRGYRLVFPELENMLENADKMWKLRAVEALAQLRMAECGPALVCAFAQPDPDVQHAARKALSELGRLAEPALVQALGHPDAHVRWHAARSLGQIKDEWAIDRLANSLYDEDRAVRWAAARVLARLDTRAIPAILRVLSRYPINEPFRQAAFHALHAMVSRRAQEQARPVLEALDGPAAAVKTPLIAQRMLAILGQG